MTTELIPFEFETRQVRVVKDEQGNPWVVAKDLAEALDYSWKGIATVSHIPEEWRGVYSVQTPSGIQEMLTLSEQGVYFFLGRSDKPKALPFQKWAAGEVFPSIRKTGSYTAPKAKPRLKSSSDAISARQESRAWLTLSKNPLLSAESQLLCQAKAVSCLNGENVAALVMPAKEDVWATPTEMAKALGRTAQWVGRALKALNRHGEQDVNHVWSEQFRDKSPYSSKEVLSYRYRRDTVLPLLQGAARAVGVEETKVLTLTGPDK